MYGLFLIVILISAGAFFLLLLYLNHQTEKMEKIQKKREEELASLEQELKNIALEKVVEEEGEGYVIGKAESRKRKRQSDHTNNAVKEFFAEIQGSELEEQLKEVSAKIKKLETIKEEKQAERVERFFNRYLPLMTEIIVASKTGETCTEKTIETFTRIVDAFYEYMDDFVV